MELASPPSLRAGLAGLEPADRTRHSDHAAQRETDPRGGPPRRALALKWLRKVHGWIGLWGAALGLLFGISGILLNHRSVMQIPAAHQQQSTLQLPLPNPAPRDAQAMAEWLQLTLPVPRAATRVRIEDAKPVAWGDRTLTQPARWNISFAGAQNSVQAEWWVGNNFVTVKRSEANVFAFLNNLHKGQGGGVAWVLLADSLAGGIILLSLTGIALWALTSRRRMVGAAIGVTGLGALAALAVHAA